MTYSEQLEREAEVTRTRLADSLGELRASLTAGRVVDHLADYAGRGDAGVFFRELRHEVARNPLPVTLIGAGIAWLALTRVTNGAANGHVTGRAIKGVGRDTMHRAEEKVGEIASSVRATARDTADTVGHEASAIYERTADKAASAYDKMSDRAASAVASVSHEAKFLREQATAGSRSALQFCREQPLVLAGIGLALGAALGALLPSTEAEDRLMGKESDEVKKTAERAVGKGAEEAKAVADDLAASSFDAAGENPDGNPSAPPPAG